ncbi:hypothetical protein Tco_1176488 [Tanacetum coccineum]
MNLHVPQEDSKEWDDQQLVVKVMEYQIGHQVGYVSQMGMKNYLGDGVFGGALEHLDRWKWKLLETRLCRLFYDVKEIGISVYAFGGS